MTSPQGAGLGYPVAISGETIVVGRQFEDIDGVMNVGAANVFDATSGALLHSLTSPTPVANQRFGIGAAVSGDNVVVGSFNGAYVFSADSGELLHTFTRPTPATGDLFGYAVAISGDTVIVGAPSDDTGATDAGAAYLFKLPAPELNNFTHRSGDAIGALALTYELAAGGSPFEVGFVSSTDEAFDENADTELTTNRLDVSPEAIAESLANGGAIIGLLDANGEVQSPDEALTEGTHTLLINPGGTSLQSALEDPDVEALFAVLDPENVTLTSERVAFYGFYQHSGGNQGSHPQWPGRRRRRGN